MNNDDFSEWLVDQMEAKGIDGWDLAKRAGISYQAVKYYTKGERIPRLDSLQAILKALNKRIVITDM